MSDPATPQNCPSCGVLLLVTGLVCPACETVVSGTYKLPLLARLGAEQQGLVIQFVLASGSLKSLARHYGVSYPTIRNLLDAVIDDVRRLGAEPQPERREE